MGTEVRPWESHGWRPARGWRPGSGAEVPAERSGLWLLHKAPGLPRGAPSCETPEPVKVCMGPRGEGPSRGGTLSVQGASAGSALWVLGCSGMVPRWAWGSGWA